MKINSFFYIIPFCLFVAGYTTISWFFRADVLGTPLLVGKRLQDVVPILAADHLTLRILGEVEDAALPEGTVISQKPTALQKIKRFQSVGVVVSSRPPAPRAPNFVGLASRVLLERAEEQGLRIKFFKTKSQTISGNCIAQYPTSGSEMPDKLLICYISEPETSINIMPDFQGKTLQYVADYLKERAIPMQLTRSTYSQAIVVTQQPRAGSFLDLNSPPTVYLTA